jgi:tetratricopeptide (TPR) repeat protein
LEKKVRSKDDFLINVFDIAVRHQSREVAVAIGNRLVAEGAASPAIYSELYDALWHLNKTSEAASILEKGLSAFPTSHSILLKSARFAMARQDYATASEKWILAHRAAPEAIECYLSGSVCLERTSHIQDALDLIKTGIQRHPENADLIRRSIEIDANIQNSDTRDILMCFESLGGTHQGCEFGNVQRHYGAEPLGLLRWAEMTPDNLMAALECGFEGVGDPENTHSGAAARRRRLDVEGCSVWHDHAHVSVGRGDGRKPNPNFQIDVPTASLSSAKDVGRPHDGREGLCLQDQLRKP